MANTLAESGFFHVHHRTQAGGKCAEGWRSEIQKAFFNFSPDPIIIHDMDMNVIDANDKAVKEFGYSKEELLEKRYLNYIPRPN